MTALTPGGTALTPGGLCAVVLAAGEGRRLRPLTELLPKALCPVGNLALLDHALRRVAGLGLSGPDTVAVNAAYLAGQVVDHVGGRAHLSVELDGPIGTSGGVGRLLDWIDGRAALIGNADAYLSSTELSPGPDIAALVDGWDGGSVRMLTRPAGPGETAEFGTARFAGFTLVPWEYLRRLTAEPAALVHTVWRPAEAAGALEPITYPGVYIDTGTPADYLAANLHATGGTSLIGAGARVTGRCESSVLGAGAVVDGTVTRGVLWPGATVHADEHLVDAVRVGTDLTVCAGR